jgi:hypothetical protein
MIKQLNRLAIVFTLSAAILVMAPVSFTAVGYLAYASKDKSNCPKNNNGNQVTVQSASQVAIGNNIKQIVIQNGDQKSIADNNNNTNCKHTHTNYNNNNDGNPSSNDNNGPTHDNNNQYLVQSAKQNAIGDNNNQFLVQNSDQTSFSTNLHQWIENLKEKILSHMFDNIN